MNKTTQTHIETLKHYLGDKFDFAPQKKSRGKILYIKPKNRERYTFNTLFHKVKYLECVERVMEAGGADNVIYVKMK